MDIVDQVILQNELVIPRWGKAYIKFRPTWKPNGDSMKVYGYMAAPKRMKKFRLAQLAGKKVEGPGMESGGAVRYERTINLSTEDPPLVEVTLGTDRVFAEGGGCMQPEPRTSPMPVWGAHLADCTGEAAMAPINEILGARMNDDDGPIPAWGANVVLLVHQAMAQAMSQPGRQPGNRVGDYQRVPGGRLINGAFVLNGEGEGEEQHPSGQEKTAGEPRTEEPGPKRPKLTPVNTSRGWGWTKNLETDGLQVGQGQDVPNDAQEAAGKMGVEAEVGTQ